MAQQTTRPGTLASASLRLLTSILDLVFPPHCVACGALGSWFCQNCHDQIAIQAPPLCQRCGRPITSGALCARCRHHPPPVDSLRSVALHKYPLSKAIHALKYDGVRVLAAPLGALMAAYAVDLRLDVDLLVPVPLHRARERERGYNQSRLLASEMSSRLGWPVVEAISRLRDTPAQVGLNRAERLANVHGAFAVTDAAVVGQRVLIIDDVCTTGATLGACAESLRRAGASTVGALTLARATDLPASRKQSQAKE